LSLDVKVSGITELQMVTHSATCFAPQSTR
jgi:hypothetical protein